jgi:hypothetical protein
MSQGSDRVLQRRKKPANIPLDLAVWRRIISAEVLAASCRPLVGVKRVDGEGAGTFRASTADVRYRVKS